MSFPGLQDRVKNSGLSLTFQDGWHLWQWAFSLSCNWSLARCACLLVPQRQRNFLQSPRDLLASKVSVVDGIKDVSWLSLAKCKIEMQN